jgi:hypothetical protein
VRQGSFPLRSQNDNLRCLVVRCREKDDSCILCAELANHVTQGRDFTVAKIGILNAPGKEMRFLAVSSSSCYFTTVVCCALYAASRLFPWCCEHGKVSVLSNPQTPQDKRSSLRAIWSNSTYAGSWAECLTPPQRRDVMSVGASVYFPTTRLKSVTSVTSQFK